MKERYKPEGNRHHLFFYRSLYDSNTALSALRNHVWLIPRLDIQTHAELHDNIPYVPPPSQHIAQRALRYFEPTGDYLQTMDSIMCSLYKASLDPRVKSVEHKGVDVTIYAIEQQKPFVRDGLIYRRAA